MNRTYFRCYGEAVAAVCVVSRDELCRYKKSSKAQRQMCFTGNPVREEVLLADPVLARTALRLDDRPFILAFGGSLGAARLNDAVTDYIEEIVKNDSVQILFGTGKRYYDAVMEDIKKRGLI